MLENAEFSPLDLVPTRQFVEHRRVYVLNQDLVFTSKKYGVVTVPRGFKTDLASVPRIVTPLFPTDGKYLEASVVHDYYYAFGIKTKKEADRLFRDGMKVLGVSRWRRWTMYWMVRLFGRGQYGHANPRKYPGYIEQDLLDDKGQPKK